MGYIQDFEVRIRVLLEEVVPEELLQDVLKEMKETVLESYRNGLKEGRKGREETQTSAPNRKPTWRKRR